MAQEIKIEIEPENYAEVYGKLLALYKMAEKIDSVYKMAEKIDSVMQSAQQSVQADVCGKCDGEGNIYSALYDTWTPCPKCTRR